MPNWIKDKIKDEDDLNKWLEDINKNSGFTSQYRISLKSKPSKLETRVWGTEYIEKKWKIEKEGRKEKVIYKATVLIPLISIIFSSHYEVNCSASLANS